jgi:hypothetical protein
MISRVDVEDEGIKELTQDMNGTCHTHLLKLNNQKMYL